MVQQIGSWCESFCLTKRAAALKKAGKQPPPIFICMASGFHKKEGFYMESARMTQHALAARTCDNDALVRAFHHKRVRHVWR
jgi:hypothetical protein